MMNMPMNSANRLQAPIITASDGDHRFELLRALRRRFDLKRRSQQRLQLLCRVGDASARLQREIDPVEHLAAAEHLLRGIDIHDREIAAERTGQPARSHDAADGESLVAVAVPSGTD